MSLLVALAMSSTIALASPVDAQVSWVQSIEHQIQEVGYENYLAQQIHD